MERIELVALDKFKKIFFKIQSSANNDSSEYLVTLFIMASTTSVTPMTPVEPKQGTIGDWWWVWLVIGISVVVVVAVVLLAIGYSIPGSIIPLQSASTASYTSGASSLIPAIRQFICIPNIGYYSMQSNDLGAVLLFTPTTNQRFLLDAFGHIYHFPSGRFVGPQDNPVKQGTLLVLKNFPTANDVFNYTGQGDTWRYMIQHRPSRLYVVMKGSTFDSMSSRDPDLDISMRNNITGIDDVASSSLPENLMVLDPNTDPRNMVFFSAIGNDPSTCFPVGGSESIPLIL